MKPIKKPTEERANKYQRMIEDALTGLDNIVYYMEQKTIFYNREITHITK